MKVVFQPTPDELSAFSSFRQEACHYEIPASLGRGPLTIKGVALRSTFKFIEAHVPGGILAVAAESKSPALALLVGKQIFASERYDVFVLPLVSQAAAALLSVPFEQFAFRVAEQASKNDSAGPYSVVFEPTKVAPLLERMMNVASLYYNFAQETSVKLTDHQADIQRPGFPAILVPWYRPVTEGYLRSALAGVGAKNLRIETYSTAEREPVSGFDAVTHHARLRWD